MLLFFIKRLRTFLNITIFFIWINCGLGTNGEVTDTSPNVTRRYEQQDVSMRCFIKDSVRVYWMKDDRVLTRGGRIYWSHFKLTSRTVSTLWIRESQLSDAGNYKCVTQNKFGVKHSAKFKLIILKQFKPRIVENSPPTRLLLYEEQEYKLACRAEAYPRIRKYTWQKKNSFISHKIQTENNKLHFVNAQKDQAGTYVCKAENSKGAALQYVEVSVLANPTLLEKPENQTLSAGSRLTLNGSFVGSDGENELKISWYLNNDTVQTGTVPDRRAGTKLISTYTVPSARVEDSGKYVLEVRNSKGRITSQANVVVFPNPEVVITEGAYLTATAGDLIQITCTAKGYPPPSVTWRNNGNIVAMTSASLSSRQTQQVTSNLTHLIYAVKGVEDYLCVATNKRGQHQGMIKITTKAKATESDKRPTTNTQDDPNKVPIIIGITSGAIILIVVIILISIKCVRRHGNEETPGQPQNRVLYNRQRGSFVDNTEFMSEPPYIIMAESPPIPAPRPKPRPAKSLEQISSRRTSQKQNASTRKKSNTSSLESPYTVILPLGQGRRLSAEDLELGQKIGSGKFGIVLKGFLNEENNIRREVAVKMLHDHAGLAERKMMLDELTIMKSISHHPNVIALVGWVITDDNVYIVEELVTGGSLLHYLRSQKSLLHSHYANDASSSFTSAHALNVAWQVASGMKYLSAQNIIHRDLAARNILIGHEDICKISDFGLARQVYRDTAYTKSNGGQLPIRWMAVESFLKGIYTSQSDVWSFGILLWEIVCLGSIPYPTVSSVKDLIEFMKAGRRMEKPINCSKDLYKIMLACWQESPSERPTFTKLATKLGRMISDNVSHIDLFGLESYLRKIEGNFEDEDSIDESNKSTIS